MMFVHDRCLIVVLIRDVPENEPHSTIYMGISGLKNQ